MKKLDFLLERIKSKKKTLLMFDYDGTLSPIVDNPDRALLSYNLREALEALSELEFLSIAIVTGRTIETLKSLSGIETHNITLSGLHGGELEVENKIIGAIFDDDYSNILREICENLKNETKDFEGILVEDKKYSVALHYRNADEATAKKAVEIFNQEIANMQINDKFKVQVGKKVIELLPIDFSKNKAVAKIIESYQGYLPFYFGDDITDISAFEEVKKSGGYSIGITPNSFFSDVFLDFEVSQPDLEKFLVKANEDKGI
jgi:trehalose-phosphatase